MPGVASGTVRAARPAIDPAFRPARILPSSLASGSAVARFPVAIPAAFALRPVLALALATGFAVDSTTGIALALVLALSAAVDSLAATHRVRSACQVIAAPVMGRVSTEI